MSSTEAQQKEDASRIELNDPMSEEEAIEQQRTKDDSTPKSIQSSESDGNTNNEVALQGFERFRENSLGFIADDRVNSVGSINSNASSAAFGPPPSDTIAEYCNESLYSYSFTPLSRVNKAAKIKKQTLNRGMDYMERIRHKDNIGRRFSQPDIGVLDHGNNDWMSSSSKAYPSMIDMASVVANKNASNNLASPPPSAPPVSIPPSLPFNHREPHYTTASQFAAATAGGRISPTEPNKAEVDEDGFNLGRRQTIEAFNNLLPIYEKRLASQPTKRSSSNNISPQNTRALHAPSRFLPQNQAILTTDSDGTILLFNDMSSLCFGIDKSFIGKTILSVIEEPFQSQIGNILRRRKSLACPLQEKGLVLVCGIVVPIKKMNACVEVATSSAASLWLKEKLTDEGKNIFIWIFEEIYETSLTTHLDDKGIVTKVIGTTKELFGYDPDQVIDKPITLLIPALSNGNVLQPGVNLQMIDKLKFYGGRSNLGVCFPTMVTSSTRHVLKIVSLPSIAGLITIHSTGKIQSINPVPAKYLFGYSTEVLVEKFDIDQIIPQFSDVVSGLRRCNLLQYSSTVNNHACRWAISDMCSADSYKSMELGQSLKSLERTPSVSANGGQALPVINAVHRDGSQFEIQLQLRLIESEEENLISIWVTYDRIHALKRSRRMADAAKKAKKAKAYTTVATASKSKNIIPTYGAPNDQQIYHHPLSPSVSSSTINNMNTTTAETENVVLVKAEEAEEEEEEEDEKPLTIKKRPSIRPYGFSAFGNSVEEHKKGLFSSMLNQHEEVTEEEEDTSSSASSSSTEQVKDLEIKDNNTTKKKHPMDDYVVIGILGEGAYGAAKLAYRKDDINKTKVVIKFIAKSRIIVDSWIRDRSMGLIPLEIHILKKLKDRPQANCCCLETYMEDDDTYFVVMKLHGQKSMDLFDYIELNEHISESQVLNIFKQVALAVKHIQSLSIVHRDIKDENILLDDQGIVHLIDFGSAAYFKSGKRQFDTFGGTLDYCAPEILEGMAYEGPPQDIWSLGTLLYTLIYRENPFYNVDEIMEHDLRIPFDLSEGSIDLIKKMLNRDVDKRYNINQVLEHPWLQHAQL